MTVQRHNNFYQTRSLFSIFAPMLSTRVFYWRMEMVDRDNGLKRALSIAMIGAKKKLHNLCEDKEYMAKMDALPLEPWNSDFIPVKIITLEEFEELYPKDVEYDSIEVVFRKPLFEAMP